jgi:hypothetical protein
MASHVYQNIFNLIVSLSIGGCPSKFMHVMMWGPIFDGEIFGCGKVYYSNSIIITNLVQTLIPNWSQTVFPIFCGIKIKISEPNN